MYTNLNFLLYKVLSRFFVGVYLKNMGLVCYPKCITAAVIYSPVCFYKFQKLYINYSMMNAMKKKCCRHNFSV